MIYWNRRPGWLLKRLLTRQIQSWRQNGSFIGLTSWIGGGGGGGLHYVNMDQISPSTSRVCIQIQNDHRKKNRLLYENSVTGL